MLVILTLMSVGGVDVVGVPRLVLAHQRVEQLKHTAKSKQSMGKEASRCSVSSPPNAAEADAPVVHNAYSASGAGQVHRLEEGGLVEVGQEAVQRSQSEWLSAHIARLRSVATDAGWSAAGVVMGTKGFCRRVLW